MTICDTCGGYYVRAPCPICTEEHIPESMSPSISTRKRHKVGTVEDQLRGNIDSTYEVLSNAETDYEAQLASWQQKTEKQRQEIEELSNQKLLLAEKEETKTAEITILKNKNTDLQNIHNESQKKITNHEHNVTTAEQQLKEKKTILENLMTELQSLS